MKNNKMLYGVNASRWSETRLNTIGMHCPGVSWVESAGPRTPWVCGAGLYGDQTVCCFDPVSLGLLLHSL
jgi:hypothetical protein